MSDLRTFYFALSADARDVFASACRTTRGHMQNVAYGYKKAAPSLAVAIERESAGVVRCESLRSDVDWAYLRGTAGNAVKVEESAHA
jgi:DNA-binding transcriptional regulator YdaS (Cro superfamily)